MTMTDADTVRALTQEAARLRRKAVVFPCYETGKMDIWTVCAILLDLAARKIEESGHHD